MWEGRVGTARDNRIKRGLFEPGATDAPVDVERDLELGPSAPNVRGNLRGHDRESAAGLLEHIELVAVFDDSGSFHDGLGRHEGRRLLYSTQRPKGLRDPG